MWLCTRTAEEHVIDEHLGMLVDNPTSGTQKGSVAVVVLPAGLPDSTGAVRWHHDAETLPWRDDGPLPHSLKALPPVVSRIETSSKI